MARGILVDPYSFDRIAKATRHVERTNRGSTGDYDLTIGMAASGWFPFFNIYTDEIPAYGCVKISNTQVYDDAALGGLYIATRPDDEFGLYAINGPKPVAQGDNGFLRFSGQGLCLYETPSGSHPDKSEGYGPKPDSFELAKGYPSLVTAYKSVNETARVMLGTLSPITTLLCKATADLSTGAVSSNYVIWRGTIASGADSGFTTLPSIEIEQDIADDAFFVAHWVNGGWVSLSNPISLTEITVITAWRVDTATMKFQYKTRTAEVVGPGTESDWTDAHTGEEC